MILKWLWIRNSYGSKKGESSFCTMDEDYPIKRDNKECKSNAYHWI